MKTYRSRPEVKRKEIEQQKVYAQQPEVKQRRKERMKPYLKMYRRKTPGRALSIKMGNAIRESLRGNKAGRKWENLVGYTANQLKAHLQKQFNSGMTWENYGKWHIDHIIPISFFQFNSPNDVEFKMCWRLENLQPLWAKDNLQKNNKIGYSFRKGRRIA